MVDILAIIVFCLVTQELNNVMMMTSITDRMQCVHACVCVCVCCSTEEEYILPHYIVL